MTQQVVFGSGATENHKHGSDTDLAVWGLDAKKVRKLKTGLNEYLLNLLFLYVTSPNNRIETIKTELIVYYD